MNSPSGPSPTEHQVIDGSTCPPPSPPVDPSSLLDAGAFRKMINEEHRRRLASNNGRVIEDTGDSKFQLTLSWDAFVDLDIQLSTPKGLCSFSERVVAGAELDVDCMPPSPWSPRRFTEVNWVNLPIGSIVCANKGLPGKYTCKVVFYSNWGSPTRFDVPYVIRSRVGKFENISQRVLAEVKDEHPICSFVVGRDGRIESFTMIEGGGGSASDRSLMFQNEDGAASRKKVSAKLATPKPAAKKEATAIVQKVAVKVAPAPKRVIAEKPIVKVAAATGAKAARKVTVPPPKKVVTVKKPAAKVIAKKPVAKATAKKVAAKAAVVAAKKSAPKAARKAPAKVAGKRK